MAVDWTFDPSGPDASGLAGPLPLQRGRAGLPARLGLYVVASGDCLSHVGTSNKISSRVGSLARLGKHRGSAEVLCAAYCTGVAPLVWWQELTDAATARTRERAFKDHYGEPPRPRPKHEGCVNGGALLRDMIAAAGEDSWEAGFAQAVVTIGEDLHLLFQPRFSDIWDRIGRPPGPWCP